MPSLRKKLDPRTPYRLEWSPKRILWISEWSDSLIPSVEWKKLEVSSWFRGISSPVRKKSTAHGRWVARKILQKICGRDVGWLERRPPPGTPTPIWPTPFHGSISHTLDAAAVLITSDGSSPGVDIQTWMNLEQTASHIKQLNSKKIEIPEFPFPCSEPEKITLLWSMQETFYKSLQNFGMVAPGRHLMRFEVFPQGNFTGNLLDDPTIVLDGRLDFFENFSLCFGVLDI